MGVGGGVGSAFGMGCRGVRVNHAHASGSDTAMGHTVVILSVMKTAVSIPDDVFEQAERLARERNISRSELYTDALRRLVQSDERVTEQLDAVYGPPDASNSDPAVRASARRVLIEADW